MSYVSSVEQLEKIYGVASPNATEKEIDYVDDIYRPFIEKAPFVALATVADEGIDCSPRGDEVGFVRIADEKNAYHARSSRQQSHRQSAQHHSGPAHFFHVYDPRQQHSFARQRASKDFDRRRTAEEL